MDWMPNAQPWPIPGHEGIDYVPGDAPWRLVLHTNEVIASTEALVNGYAQRGWYPHVTADPRTRTIAQHVSFARAVTTTKNAPGGVETNRLHALQVELVGFAADAAYWPDEWCEWLGAHVIAPILMCRPIRLVGPPRPWVDARDGFIARPDAPQRMTAVEWAYFDGICGHQHVPENDHWDPGRLREDRVFAAAGLFLDPEEDDEVATPRTFIVTRDRSGGDQNVGRWITDFVWRRKIKGSADEDVCVFLGALREADGTPIVLGKEQFDAIAVAR